MNFNTLKQELERFSNIFEIKSIGKTYLGRDIFAISPFIKPYKDSVIITSSIHAREHITCDLLVKFMHTIKLNYEILDYLHVNLFFIPMMNPDGVELCINGLDSVSDKDVRKELLDINGNEDFSLWKANARGVDLNNNFNVDWDKFKNNKFPSPQGYIGIFPESEKETKALVNFTNEIKPFFTLSYHAKGEEIYYQYFQKKYKNRDKKIAKLFAESTGYKIKNVQKNSSGGYKDWCIKAFNIPSLTIEVGNNDLSHPISHEELIPIYKQNFELFSLIKKSYSIYKQYTK